MAPHKWGNYISRFEILRCAQDDKIGAQYDRMGTQDDPIRNYISNGAGSKASFCHSEGFVRNLKNLGFNFATLHLNHSNLDYFFELNQFFYF